VKCVHADADVADEVPLAKDFELLECALGRFVLRYIGDRA
jgi:hypothetical protein